MKAELVNSTPAKWYTLLGLILVPLLVAGGFLFAGVNSGDRLRTVQAAVVNLDEPVEIDGQYTPLGRQLTANLVDSDRTENLTWVLADEDDARAGLTTGEFAAMVVIPENFSAAATSFAENEGDAAEQATIQVHTSPVAGVADATLGKLVASEAAKMLNQMLTESYLDQIYIGFNDMGEQFVTMADGATELADGARSLADGIGEAADGSGQLYTGARALADGLGTMHTKTADLPSGTRQLADGLGTLHKKTKDLPTGTQQLADGLGELATGTKDLPTGSATLAKGLSEYVAGVNQVVDQNITALPLQIELASGVKKLSQGAGSLSGGLKDYQSAMSGLGSDSTVVKQAKAAAESAVSGVPCPFGDDAAACAAFAAGLNAGAGAGAEVGVNVGGNVAAAGLDQGLISGAAQVAGGMGQLSDQLAASVPSADQVDAQVAQLKQLKAGGTQLAGGMQTFADGMPALASGVSQLAGGADQLAEGMPALVDGIGKLADGADELADGMPALVDGIGQSADGAVQLADGVDQLGAGLITAADGGDKLADGMKKMADGIVEGKDKLPSYSESDRENLSTVVASPVQTDDLAGLANANVGWISLVLVLALWLGALAMYAVTKAIGAGLLSSSEPTAVLIGRSLLPGAVVVGIQALVVAGLAQFGLDVSPQKWLAITGVLLLAGFTFVVLNHALVAWFGGIGRLVSIGFAVLTTADALTSAAPGLFEALRPFSPLTPALDAIRAIVTESSGATIAVLLLVGWLLLGLAASSVAIARRRTTSLTAVIAAG